MISGNYINQMASQQTNDIDNTIINYVKSLGYEMKEPYIESLSQVQNELKKRNQMIRCETFCMTVTSNDPISISIKTVVIPFIDSISHPIPKSEIKKMCKLGEEWY